MWITFRLRVVVKQAVQCYIHEGSKDYYIKTITANLPNYTIQVQYDTTAIPEYSTIALIVAMVLITGTLVAVKKKMQNKK